MAKTREQPSHIVRTGLKIANGSFRRGAKIARRYLLRRLLGRGGFAEVWEAEDRLGADASAPPSRVAVKILTRGEPIRIRQEVLLLQHLRLPGVVRLLDEGTDRQRPFIVMELVEGTPFPGAEGERAWPAIRDTTVALLETLAAVHAMGVLHRDLKPDNVLVDAQGRPTLLDFGISRDERRDERLTMDGAVLGSPRYLAPEQILGDVITNRTDLYGVGLLMYEALSGEVPHAAEATGAIARARISRPAQPLRDRAPNIPASIAATIDRLLAPDPADRPSSAQEVLRLLGLSSPARSHRSIFTRFDGGKFVEPVLSAAQQGKSVDVLGVPGSGREPCLREVETRLIEEGRRCLWAKPDRVAFGSLEPIIGPLGDVDIPYVEVVACCKERLRACLSGGTIVFVADDALIDRWSAALLEGCLDAGSILCGSSFMEKTTPRPHTAVVRLHPIHETDLQTLFSGPERIFHLRTDAARLLWARTSGLAAYLDEEIDAWVRMRIARWDGDSLAIDRDALDRIAEGISILPVLHRETHEHDSPSIPSPFRDLAAWVKLAWPRAGTHLLARALGQPRWRIEASLEELARLGVIRFSADGNAEAATSIPVEGLWTHERRNAAHRALAEAMNPGDEGRFRHLLASDVTADLGNPEAAEEAAHVAQKLTQDGYLGRAVAALHQGLTLARTCLSPGSTARRQVEERLLCAWVDVAIAERTSHAYSKLLYEMARPELQTSLVKRLSTLVGAAAAISAGGDRALRQLTNLDPFEELELERHRQALRAAAARPCSEAVEERVLAEMSAWVDAQADAASRAQLASCLGRLRYRQGRFVEAATLYAQAAKQETSRAARIAATISCASALVEAFQHEEAILHAQEALHEAERLRIPLLEARATWALRVAKFRMGQAMAPDIELVDAVGKLGAQDFEATLTINEAAIAYRAGLNGEAFDLASRAHGIWAFVQMEGAVTFARCLALAARGERPAPVEEQRLFEESLICRIPGVGIQSLALLAELGFNAVQHRADELSAQVALVPREHWNRRMDLFSVTECMQRIDSRSDK